MNNDDSNSHGNSDPIGPLSYNTMMLRLRLAHEHARVAHLQAAAAEQVLATLVEGL